MSVVPLFLVAGYSPPGLLYCAFAAGKAEGSLRARMPKRVAPSDRCLRSASKRQLVPKDAPATLPELPRDIWEKVVQSIEPVESNLETLTRLRLVNKGFQRLVGADPERIWFTAWHGKRNAQREADLALMPEGMDKREATCLAGEKHCTDQTFEIFWLNLLASEAEASKLGPSYRRLASNGVKWMKRLEKLVH